MAEIKIDNLKKHYGSTKAVDGVSFEVGRGEIFGFLGPNGAGKTTTIRCMMDFVRPTSGKIEIFGKSIRQNIVELKKSVSYLPANMQFYGNLTGKDHIDLVQKLRGGSSRTKHYIEELGFNPSVRVKTLSTGNKQKLGLILAMIGEPRLLILDEPTAGLDPILQSKIYKLLNDLVQNNGSTVFMSSHYLHEVEENCSRVAIIKEGKLVATESISSLKQKNMYVATIHFSNDFVKEDFESEGMAIKEKHDGVLIVNIRGDIDTLIKKLAKYSLKSLEITRAPLEEVFLEYYEV